ncbi:MAG: outer membrane protein assembly factor BamC [Rhodanobacteraceae bacterium]|nr:outer membrane protein assembly factor BamC [Rhodanobacteraceae bacterium]
MLRARLASAGKLVLVAALCLPYGCSLINRPIVYEDARETPPLQVPNGLIAPAPNPALQIPAVAGMASNVDAAPPTLGNTVAVARAGLPRAANAVLSLDDEADSAFRRVGIALERSGCCRMVSRDPAAKSYQVELTAAAPKAWLLQAHVRWRCAIDHHDAAGGGGGYRRHRQRGGCRWWHAPG